MAKVKEIGKKIKKVFKKKAKEKEFWARLLKKFKI